MVQVNVFGCFNGCVFVDLFGYILLQWMVNVLLQLVLEGLFIEEFISNVECGIYIKGDCFWLIDMQCFNFQFTGQQFYCIENGQLVGQLCDVVYQVMMIDFWGSMEVVGGLQIYLFGGVFNCGKGQFGQVVVVSYGCLSVLFWGVNVFNIVVEGG